MAVPNSEKTLGRFMNNLGLTVESHKKHTLYWIKRMRSIQFPAANSFDTDCRNGGVFGFDRPPYHSSPSDAFLAVVFGFIGPLLISEKRRTLASSIFRIFLLGCT